MSPNATTTLTSFPVTNITSSPGYMPTFASSRLFNAYLGLSAFTFIGSTICEIRASKETVSWRALGKILAISLLRGILSPVSLPYYGVKCIKSNYYNAKTTSIPMHE